MTCHGDRQYARIRDLQPGDEVCGGIQRVADFSFVVGPRRP